MTITREDIEAKAMEIVEVFEETKESVKDKAVMGAAAVAIVVAAAFIIGRRRGSRHKTMVEIYRV